MQNLEILDVFDFLITQKLLKCLKDPFVRSALICIYAAYIISRQFFQRQKILAGIGSALFAKTKMIFRERNRI